MLGEADASVTLEQFNDLVRRPAAMEPIQRLMLAVLVDGIDCVLSRSETRRDIAEARTWVASDSEQGPFDFVTICDHLGLNIDAIRKQLRRIVRGSDYRVDLSAHRIIGTSKCGQERIKELRERRRK